ADHPLSTATRWIRARVLVATGELAAARRVRADVDDTDDPSLRVLRATVAALGTGQAEVRSWLEGERLGARHLRLDPGATGRSWEAIHLRTEATRALVLAMGARQAAARTVIAQVAEQMTRFRGLGVLDAVLSAYDRAMISQLLLEAHLCCGDLDEAVDLAETLLTARHGNPQAVQFAELVLVVVEVLTGRLEEGGASAARVVAQARAAGDRCVLGVARALVAFCRGAAEAGEPDVDHAGRPAGGDDGSGAPDPAAGWGRLGWLAQVLRAATRRPGEPAGSAEARLVGVADRARAADLGAVELFALLGAGLMGDVTVAGRLGEVAVATQAAASAPAADLAAALASGDPERYGAALGGLVTARHTLWQDAGLARVADRLPRGAARRLADLASRRRGDAAPTERVPDWVRLLTPREREVAELVVDGRSNAAVARQHSISIRTVEGHLNQIYAKLDVRGRAALTRLATGIDQLRPVG
ncbi:MAG: LuxR C-terminal-related transcriptional regulator, partial [Actinomycetaceae bacterium]